MRKVSTVVWRATLYNDMSMEDQSEDKEEDGLKIITKCNGLWVDELQNGTVFSSRPTLLDDGSR